MSSLRHTPRLHHPAPTPHHRTKSGEHVGPPHSLRHESPLSQAAREDDESREIVTSVCGVCPGGCAIEAHRQGNELVGVRPARGDQRGLLCMRGARGPDILYSEDRLLFPQMRQEPSARFSRCSWNDAYDRIVKTFDRIARQHGPEAVAIYTGRGNFDFGLNEAFAPAETVESSANAVLFPFGSPNTTGVGSLCYSAFGMIATKACFGGYMREMQVDLEHADLILLWGANPATDSPPLNMRRLHAAERRGARIVVIDHRRSESARALDAEWIGIRPGTDGALALSLMHVMIEEEIYDRRFVHDWTHGFDELADYVRAFRPERAALITGIAPSTIRELARRIGTTRRASVLMYSGLEYSNSGVQAIRAVWCVQALAGHIDTKGGNQFKAPGRPRLARLLTPAPEGGRPPIGKTEFPLYYEVRREAHASLLPRAILEGEPYPVRALIVSGASIITAWPNPALWRKALAALDLLVVVNRFPTADAELAHVLLPAATGFECESYVKQDSRVRLRRRVVRPLGECRSDYEIFAELARRLGYGHRWPQSDEKMICRALKGSGITLEELAAAPGGIELTEPGNQLRKFELGLLRPDGAPGFATPTGKFELSSTWLASRGYDPLPVYTEPREGPLANPKRAARFPLILNTGARTQTAFRSQHHNIEALVKKQPWPLVHMHKEDAKARGIAHGDDVDVVTARGRVRFRARVDAEIVRGVVEANMGGGGPLGPLAWRRANVNELTDAENFDPISGFPVYKALLCDVVACRDEKTSEA